MLPKIVAIQGYIQITYLAIYPDKLLLLDSGCRCDVEKILNYITQVLQRPLSQLKVVMVTHMHPDHAGGAELLRQKTNCQVVSFSASQGWYQGIRGRINHFNDLGLTYFVASRNGKAKRNIWYSPQLNADIYLKEGDRIPEFEDWQILETAGHTNHDISLWHAHSKRVYTADLILRMKGKFVSPYLITLPRTYKKSLIKIKNLQPIEVLLAHGGQSHISPKEFDNIIANAPKQPRQTSKFIKASLDIIKKRKAKLKAV